jgi:hypothetical protein
VSAQNFEFSTRFQIPFSPPSIFVNHFELNLDKDLINFFQIETNAEGDGHDGPSGGVGLLVGGF